MSTNVTPWFPRDVSPARKGDYQIAPFSKDAPWWSYWNGEKWSFFTREQVGLRGRRGNATHSANFPWRGLASDPSKESP